MWIGFLIYLTVRDIYWKSSTDSVVFGSVLCFPTHFMHEGDFINIMMNQKLTRISEHVVYLPPYQETDRPVLAAISGDKFTLLMDAGNSSNHAKLWLSQLAEHNIKGDWLVLTHWHWDHVFGLSEMNMPALCNTETLERIREMQQLSWEDQAIDKRVLEGTEIPFCADAMKKELGMERDIRIAIPEITFSNKMSMDLGGVTCVIEHVGGDHSSDSTILYIPEEKILFLGDCLYANMYAKKWCYTKEKVTAMIAKLEQYDTEIAILSHGAEPLKKADFNAYIELLKQSSELTDRFQGNLKQVTDEMTSKLHRPLNDLENETIQFFIHGYRQ